MLTKLSALLLLGLVTVPSIAAARPKAGSNRTPAAASDRATARDTDRPERERVAKKKVHMEGLCARLECTPEQRVAIRTIRNETRERLMAGRKEMRELFHEMKADRKGALSRGEAERLKAEIERSHRELERIVAGAINRIGGVLDDGQRAKLMRMVNEHGAKVVFGGFGQHHGKGKKALRAKRSRGDASASDLARAKRARGLRAAKLEKRDRA